MNHPTFETSVEQAAERPVWLPTPEEIADALDTQELDPAPYLDPEYIAVIAAAKEYAEELEARW